MTEEQVQLFGRAFDGMKARWEELNSKIDKQRADGDSFAADVREQLGALGGAAKYGGGYRQTLGQQFVSSAEFQSAKGAMRDGGALTWKIDGVAFTSKVVGNVVLGDIPNSIAPPTYIAPGFLPQLPSNIRQLIPSRPVASELIRAVREEGSEGSAGVQGGEGNLKPQVDMKFTPHDLQLETYSAWTKVSTQCLEDLSWIESAISTTLASKIGAKEEVDFVAALVAAAGAGPAGTTGMTAIDILATAQNQLAAAGWSVSGTMINPTDALGIRLLKTTTGEYLTTPTWLGPIVTSPAVTAGQYITGAFSTAAVILDRDSYVKVNMGLDRDDFIRNLRTILAEQRTGLWIAQPSGFLKGSLTVTP